MDPNNNNGLPNMDDLANPEEEFKGSGGDNSSSDENAQRQQQLMLQLGAHRQHLVDFSGLLPLPAAQTLNLNPGAYQDTNYHGSLPGMARAAVHPNYSSGIVAGGTHSSPSPGAMNQMSLLAMQTQQNVASELNSASRNTFSTNASNNYALMRESAEQQERFLRALAASSAGQNNNFRGSDPLGLLRGSTGNNPLHYGTAAFTQMQPQLRFPGRSVVGMTGSSDFSGLGFPTPPALASNLSLLQSQYDGMDALTRRQLATNQLINPSGTVSSDARNTAEAADPASYFARSPSGGGVGVGGGVNRSIDGMSDQLRNSDIAWGAAPTSSPSSNAPEDDIFPTPDIPTEPRLPPVEEGETPHHSMREFVPLAIAEDPNWLSERQCFIRAELLEVIRASHAEVLVRSSSKSIAYQQVGIRCRFCAHLQPSARAIRSSAYPSSIRQLYQSFTMMVRDHWMKCSALPPHLMRRFTAYQEHKIPSSSLSRQYWAYAAEKLGMVDAEDGIIITEETQAAAQNKPSFGTDDTNPGVIQATPVELLISPDDSGRISPYLSLLMNQLQKCYMLPFERVGKRRDAPVGLSGFGCQFCCQRGRLGFCRIFPLNKRSLPTKIKDIHTHLIRCPLVPNTTKTLLRQLKQSSQTKMYAERDRDFIDKLWSKLGRTGFQI